MNDNIEKPRLFVDFEHQVEIDEEYIRNMWPDVSDDTINAVKQMIADTPEGYKAFKDRDMHEQKTMLTATSTLGEFAAYMEANEPGEVMSPWGWSQAGYSVHGPLQTEFPFLQAPDGYTIEASMDERIGMDYMEDDSPLAELLTEASNGEYVDGEWKLTNPKLNDQVNELINMVRRLTLQEIASFGEMADDE